jgi:hypothetical protein
MKILKVFALTAALGATSPALAQAPAQPPAQPSPEAIAAARELMSLTTETMLGDLVKAVTAQTWPPIEQMLRTRFNVDDNAIAELRREFERLQMAEIGQILQEAPAIYARYFTVDELKGIIAFYRTPVGMKTLKVMPQAMGEFTQLMVPRLQIIQQKVQAAFEQILKARGYLR